MTIRFALLRTNRTNRQLRIFKFFFKHFSELEMSSLNIIKFLLKFRINHIWNSIPIQRVLLINTIFTYSYPFFSQLIFNITNNLFIFQHKQSFLILIHQIDLNNLHQILHTLNKPPPRSLFRPCRHHLQRRLLSFINNMKISMTHPM